MSKNHLNSLGANFPSCNFFVYLWGCNCVDVWVCSFSKERLFFLNWFSLRMKICGEELLTNMTKIKPSRILIILIIQLFRNCLYFLSSLIF